MRPFPHRGSVDVVVEAVGVVVVVTPVGWVVVVGPPGQTQPG